MQDSQQSRTDHHVDLQLEQLTQPAPILLRYYIVCSLPLGPFFLIALIPLACKYLTLRYRFDQDGISMCWGVLFRREIYLTYRRIQDIHLTRNLIQRWFGLATLAVQTASGSATPEMCIEGILEAEPLRDHLYAMMRGARNESTSETQADTANQEALSLLKEIRNSMRALASKNHSGNGAKRHE